jgi:hypothetical protein
LKGKGFLLFRVIAQPVRGVRRDGAIGGLLGVVSGILGVAIKPATGLLDAVVKTSDGLRCLALGY